MKNDTYILQNLGVDENGNGYGTLTYCVHDVEYTQEVGNLPCDNADELAAHLDGYVASAKEQLAPVEESAYKASEEFYRQDVAEFIGVEKKVSTDAVALPAFVKGG